MFFNKHFPYENRVEMGLETSEPSFIRSWRRHGRKLDFLHEDIDASKLSYMLLKINYDKYYYWYHVYSPTQIIAGWCRIYLEKYDGVLFEMDFLSFQNVSEFISDNLISFTDKNCFIKNDIKNRQNMNNNSWEFFMLKAQVITKYLNRNIDFKILQKRKLIFRLADTELQNSV